MKVKSLKPPHDLIVWDTRTSKWPLKSEALCRSKVQYRCGQVLKEKYPHDPIAEDVTIPGSRLSLDFYLPLRKMAIEVQGKQHTKHVPFYHGPRRGKFLKQQERDVQKEMFCELNDIILYKVQDENELKELLS